MHDVNKLLDQKAVSAKFAEEILELYNKFDKVFAVLDVDDTGESSIPEEVLNLLEERQAARKAKDFAKSDEIRDKLNADGWIIEDSPEGPTVKKR
jgi:cysteinyl-tRNA synthetase